MMRLAANDVEAAAGWHGVGTAQPSGQPFNHTITTGMVDELCSFLAATETDDYLWGQLQAGQRDASAAEAAYVMGKVCFEYLRI